MSRSSTVAVDPLSEVLSLTKPRRCWLSIEGVDDAVSTLQVSLNGKYKSLASTCA
jgi:hypothetical protein